MPKIWGRLGSVLGGILEGLGKDLGRFGRILRDLGTLGALGAILGFFSGFFACIFKHFMQFCMFWTSQAARWRVRTIHLPRCSLQGQGLKG